MTRFNHSSCSHIQSEIYYFHFSDVTNADSITSSLETKDLNKIIVLIQKAVEGVLHNYHMSLLQTSGLSCEDRHVTSGAI